MRGLSALTPDVAAQTAMPKSAISTKAGFTQTVYNDIVQAAQQGNFAAFNPSGCQGVSAGNNLRIAQTAGGLALTGVNTAAALGVGIAVTVAPFIAPIVGLISLFPLIFGHHAAAVKKEQQTICASVPAASNYLDIIQQSVQSGQFTPQEGQAALQSLLSDFTQQVSSIIKNNASQCNAACVWVKELTAIVAELTSQYQDMIAAGPSTPVAPAANQAAAAAPATAGAVPAGSLVNSVASSVVSTIQSTSAATGLPDWAFWLGGGFLLWKLL